MDSICYEDIDEYRDDMESLILNKKWSLGRRDDDPDTDVQSGDLKHGGMDVKMEKLENLNFFLNKNKGLPVYVMDEDLLDGACTDDHTWKELQLDLPVPITDYEEISPVDRTESIPYQWLQTEETKTFGVLLQAESDFIRFQALYWLHDRLRHGNLSELHSFGETLLCSLTHLLVSSENVGVRRLAAGILRILSVDRKFREDLVSHPNLIQVFFDIVTGKVEDMECITRVLVSECLVEMTSFDWSTVDFILHNINMENIFSILKRETDDNLKTNVLKLFINLLDHPLALESLASLNDYSMKPPLLALTSLVPKYHHLSFNILDRFLRSSKANEKFHEIFCEEDGVVTLVNLLEEVHVIDPEFAMNILILFDHLAESTIGAKGVISTGQSILRSLVYYRNTDKSETRAHKKTLPSPISIIVYKSKQIDEYNTPNAPISHLMDLPLDFSFLEDNGLTENYIVESSEVGMATVDELPVKKQQNEQLFLRGTTTQKQTNQKNLKGKDKSLAMCENRIFWRQYTNQRASGEDTSLIKAARKVMDRATFSESGALDGGQCHLDNGVRMMALEVLAQLATHSFGTELVIGLIRNVCPVLRKQAASDPSIGESAAYCLELLLKNNSEKLHTLLDKYYLMRDLFDTLEKDKVKDRVKAGVLGVIATLVKQGCNQARHLSDFNIRLTLTSCLKNTPEGPVYPSLYSLVIIYYLAREYRIRDFIMGKTIIRNLFRIIQDDRTEEICRIYATCCLGYLTFANRRFIVVDVIPDGRKKSKGMPTSSIMPSGELEEAPLCPTMESFRSAEVGLDFFIPTIKRYRESPADFFSLFLVQLLLSRSVKDWGKYLIKHYSEIFLWLLNGIKENKPLFQSVYTTIFHSMPTLSFYHHGVISPWSRIDDDTFYFCPEDNDLGSFPQFLQMIGEVSPIYYVYRVSIEENTTQSLSDSQSDNRRKCLIVPEGHGTVYPDSIFGQASVYRPQADSKMMVWSTDGIFPEPPSEAVVYIWTEEPDRAIQEKPTSTFQRSKDPFAYGNKYFRQRKPESCLRPVVLQTMNGHMKSLANSPHVYLTEEESEDDVPSISDKCEENKLRKDVYSTVQDMYKHQCTNWTWHQMKLLTEALSDPPKLWVEAFESSDSRSEDERSKVKKLNRLVKPPPIQLFVGVQPSQFETHLEPKESIEQTDIIMDAAKIISSKMLTNVLKKKRIPPYYRKDVADWVPPEKDFKWFHKLNHYGKAFLGHKSSLSSSSHRRSAKKSRFLSRIRYTYRRESTVDKSEGMYSFRRTNYSPSKRDGTSGKNYGKLTSLKNENTIIEDLGSALYSYWKSVGGPTNETKEGSSKYVTKALQASPLIHWGSGPEKEKSKRSVKSMNFKQQQGPVEDQDINIPTQTRIVIGFFMQPKEVDNQLTEKVMNNQKILGFIPPLVMIKEMENLSPERNPDFYGFIEYVRKGVVKIMTKRSRKRCWYSDIIKFIAMSVSHRLEGPFGYVNEYLMNHHRRELKISLRSSVIHIGSVQIGWQLERAILFKLLADLFIIPCGLQKSSKGNAWVEVLRNPFSGTKEICIVDLIHKPGRLLKVPSDEGDEYRGLSTRSRDESVDPYHDICNDRLQIRERFANYIKKGTFTKSRFEEDESSVSFEDIIDSETLEESFENKEEEQGLDYEGSECSFPLFSRFSSQVQTKSAASSVSQQSAIIKEIRLSGIDRKLEKYNRQRVTLSFDKEKEHFVKFSWRSDPDGQYTTVIGRAEKAWRREKDMLNHFKPQRLKEEAPPWFSYEPATQESLLDEIFPYRLYPGPENIEEEKLDGDEEEEEADEELFRRWEEVLSRGFKTPEDTSSDMSGSLNFRE